jgi:hypothetical protein
MAGRSTRPAAHPLTTAAKQNCRMKFTAVLTCHPAAAAPADDARARLEVGGRRTPAALQGYAAAITVGNSRVTTSQPNVAGNVAAFAEQ